jgi:ABC-2 type transport system ATP-binding protein
MSKIEMLRAQAQSTLSENLPLKLTQLQKTLGHAQVLRSVDLVLQPGDILGLLGANGAGKSTLIKTSVGLLRADAGAARLFGEESHALSDASKTRLAYVPQELDLFGWLTGADLFELMRSLYQNWNQADATALASNWKVPLHSRIASLSIGLRQRLQIVRALATQADLLILDEPVGSLDPAGRRQFLGEMLGRCAERQTTVLFSTHIVSDLERCANKVAVLHQGKILLCEELDALKQNLFRIEMPRAQADQLANNAAVLNIRHLSAARSMLVLMLNLDQLDHWRAQVNMSHPMHALGLEDLMVELAT